MREKNKKSYPPRGKNRSRKDSNSKSSNGSERSPSRRKSSGDFKKGDWRENRKRKETSQTPGKNKRPNNRGRVRGRSSGGLKKSDLDPSTLVNKTIKVKDGVKEIETRAFVKLDIHPHLQEKIKRKGYEFTTEIQDKTFEFLSSGKSVIGIANTGTGKTGAFLIPIINRLIVNKNNNKSLVLVPTRELAQQVEQEFKSLSKGLKIYSSCFIGGTSINKDLDKLRRINHIIIGTPGRINDMINRRALKLNDFSNLVLDEFDTMLDMGFLHEVQKIIDQMHKRRQTILFSATENIKQQGIINGIVNGYERVRVSDGQANTDNIYQEVIKTKGDDEKIKILVDLLGKKAFKKVLIFSETKRQVSKLCRQLKKLQIKVDEIHGDKSQQYRSKAIQKFKSSNIQVLVATDVASRGIDIDNITHVINYRIPNSKESYIHRIGRTGRAGKEGSAITFV
jgi:ATP-dependent RNA helicase RhlE